MNDLNSILLEGNLTRDPVLSSTPSGVQVCNFAVGTHYRYKKNDEPQDETSFFDVEAWSRLAENCAEYLKKGRGVRVVGRLKQDRWKDAEGQPRSRIKVVAEHVEFRSSPRKNDSGGIAGGTEEESPEQDEYNQVISSREREAEVSVL
ncbi:single-stranded DNA-binding protein [Alkalispirochaeta sphaeroplastigenens]|uniref:Single-stranded DNA-binding protein n=1 Tax=Alkalispirochaeta sphaeroplastigenens TaxID=1187066 RepID=A0A2S4JX33_9SPIO|nr:single-stranded DNA-binding protein [Alkalispirochaeta sphaeroplastigenens]POR04082.1 single-stranded DNA-binding protein [Alkalispirochaeta sphaeroplastigenens]